MHTQTTIETDRLRAGHARLALALKPELFLTLATNTQMSIGLMQRKTWGFLARMDEVMLGRNWSKAPKSKRMDGLLYVEHVHSNIHVHGLMTRPYCNRIGLQLRADKIWRDLCPSGSVVFKDVGDITKRSEYVTKEAGKYGFFEHQFFTAVA